MKLLIGVLACDDEIFTPLINNGIKTTWGCEKHDNVEIVYYYGKKGHTFQEDSNVYLDIEESRPNIGHKTLKFFEYILKNKRFDFLFRTNASSYVNIKNLQKYLGDKPFSGFYSGFIGRENGVDFASGSGYTITPDLVSLSVNRQEYFNHSMIDDVALSNQLRAFGHIPLAARRQNFFEPENVFNDIDKTQFHYRCRSVCNGDRDARSVELDTKIIQNIHKALQNG